MTTAEMVAEWVAAGWTPIPIETITTAHYAGQHDAAPDGRCPLGRCGDGW